MSTAGTERNEFFQLDMFETPVGAEELREAAAHFMEHMRRRALE